MHAHSGGMALLARLPDERVAELLPPDLRRFTAATVTDPQAVVARLGHIRRSQLAIEIEERDLGICSIATAVTGPTGALQALVMMLPAARFKVKMGLVIEGLRQLRHGQRLHDQEFPSDRVSESFTVATASRTAS